ncbi:hypothetical protein TraAM80_10227 [Trypanosoma rangeli]|uniref:Uncharacterized protein n=1 Tax=Trypanosoma rangeli TaxID=5698 RepID=A0A422MQE8_TRYRA|nr:uncharacterized protein TraAM80_10227 [Trypanosoma rangeli]RNE95423.1 hypothetical protein TraAM80_10227 [Trypanosoma rangeli]|eukprot:RNE95423.1 hypothetical protein TraAM80_10227 [Trypanosoma rangeli]
MDQDQTQRPRSQQEAFNDFQPRRKCALCCGVRCASHGWGSGVCHHVSMQSCRDERTCVRRTRNGRIFGSTFLLAPPNGAGVFHSPKHPVGGTMEQEQIKHFGTSTGSLPALTFFSRPL